MKVEALRMGYFGHKRQREGKVFEIEHIDQFSFRWMKALDFTPPPETKPRVPFMGQHTPTVKENEKAPTALSKATKATGEQQVI